MFQVSCSEGFDGGLPQEFVAEVYLQGHKNLFAYVNSKWVALRQMEFHLISFRPLNRTPLFELKGLEPGMSYDVLVMAVNKKGKSGPVMLQGYTLKSPEKQTGEANNYDDVAARFSFLSVRFLSC